MKLSVLYFSKSGVTKMMAEAVARGMREVEGAEVGVFSIEDVDMEFLKESKGVVLGTPTYHANPTWQVKKWLDETNRIYLVDKLGGAFATADYIHGGGDVAVSTILTHMMTFGMLCYSGGSAFGKPYIHMGPVAIKENKEDFVETFEIYGKRFASKASELFA